MTDTSRILTIPKILSVQSLAVQIFAPLTLPLERLCRNPSSSLRATEGSVAISFFSIPYEIASVVSLSGNDIAAESPMGEGRERVVFTIIFLRR